MAWDATDWTIDRQTGNIRYIGDDHGGASPTYVTVIDFHRELQKLADDGVQAVTDDELAIYDTNPSSRSTDNIIRLLGNYNIDDNAAEHIYDGSIIQGSGATETIYDGVVNFGNASVQIQIHQDGAVLADDWWNIAGPAGLNADAGAGISHRFMLKVREFGADIDGRRVLGTSRTFNNTYSEFPINGTSRGNNVLALSDTSDLNNATAAGTVSGWTGITVTEGYRSIDVDNNGTPENYADEWNTNQPTRSINDFYERLKWLTRDGSASTLHGINGELYRGITHEIAYDGATNGGPVENNYLAWGTTFNYDTELSSGLTVGEYYTFATSGAVGQLLALDDDGTTGFCVFAIEAGTGPVVNDDAFTRVDGTANDGATVNEVTPTVGNGGWGLVIADDGADQVWIQLLKGVAPADNQVMYEATSAGVHDTATDGTATVNVTVTARPISTPFVGASTGSAIIGSYGLGIEAADLTANDKVFDLTNTQITPPNNVTYNVNGAVASEDRILVAPWDGTTLDVNGNPEIDFNQLTLNTSLLGATETSIVTTAAIPSDTPSSGTIRVELDNGEYFLQSYTSWTGSTFTIPSTDYSVATGNGGATQPKNIFISYIDKVAAADPEPFTVVYNANRNLVIIVRDGGTTPIKEFISSGLLTSSGGDITVIRTSDT